MLKKNLLIIFIVFILAIIIALTLNSRTSTNAPTITTGQMAPQEINLLTPFDLPEISMTLMDGRITGFQSEDHMILVNFWATWCPPCVVEFPEIIEFTNAHPGFELYLVSGDMEDDDLNEFLESQPTEIKNLIAQNPRIHLGHDPTGDIIRNTFQTFKLPETYIIKNAQIIAKVNGPITAPGYDYIANMNKAVK